MGIRECPGRIRRKIGKKPQPDTRSGGSRKTSEKSWKNCLHFSLTGGYNIDCCDMIAVKREVAVIPNKKGLAGFPWSECLGDESPEI